MKKTDYRTKTKQVNEANASEAKELIQDYLDSFDRNSNLKTKKILEEVDLSQESLEDAIDAVWDHLDEMDLEYEREYFEKKNNPSDHSDS